MLDIDGVLKLLESRSFRNRVDAGTARLGPPLSSAEMEQANPELPAPVRQELSRLLGNAGYISIHPFMGEGSGCEDEVVSMSFETPGDDDDLWGTVYPGACMGGVGEELLFWDVSGDPAGAVFSVCHDGPWHCLAYLSLEALIEDMLATAPEDCFDKLLEMARVRPRTARVGRFAADDEELRQFLARFPEHYSVFDMRNAAEGDAFPYNATGPQGMTRWGNRYLWVLKEPRSWWEALRWWWRQPS